MHQPIGGEEPVSVFLTIGKLELARLRVKIRVAVQRAVQPLAAVRSAVIKSAALPVIARKNKARDGFTRLLSFFIVGANVPNVAFAATMVLPFAEREIAPASPRASTWTSAPLDASHENSSQCVDLSIFFLP